jgi:ATP-dependent RNA helicase DDX49/DBP8
VPSHVRESYLFYLLCNPPEPILHLRRQPIIQSQTGSRKRGSTKKTGIGDDEIDQPPRTIIFCAKARTAAYLTALLQTLAIRSTALHSRLTQRDRLTSLSLFRASVIPVLVSTDVGARGLDIVDVALVINWDLPNEPEEYTHRVGRTARAGRGGIAISFVSENDENRVLKIEERIGKLSKQLGGCRSLTFIPVATQLVEMEVPEDKVLEKLNKVSTAKRQAFMVSAGPRIRESRDSNVPPRNCTTRTLGRGKRSTRQRQPNSDS